MTEDEMKQTWCPDARCAEGGYNRDADGGRPVGRCLGSACSAWRWASEEPKVEAHAGDPKEPFRVLRETAERRGYTIIRELPREGYCGRAGRPA